MRHAERSQEHLWRESAWPARGGITNGGGSCTTGADGHCTVSKNNIRSTATATFSVTALSGSNVSYNAGANHDPDGDSNGTTIGVANP